MQIVVFGASGRTGRRLVAQALGRGHGVTAYVRDAVAFEGMVGPEVVARITVVQGALEDGRALRAAVAGADAVLSALGARSMRPPVTVYSRGTGAIIEAMKIEGVRRLVCISAAGAADPEDRNLPRAYRLLVMRGALRHVYADMRRMEASVLASGLDWTIVRPAGLLGGERVGPYRVAEGDSLPRGRVVSRAEVADFMLEAAAKPDWIGKAVAVAR